MTKKLILVCLAVVTVLAMALLPAGSASLADENADEVPAGELPPKGHDKLESALDQLVRAEQQGIAEPFLLRHGLKAADGRVRVVVEAQPGNEEAAITRTQALGGTLETSYQNLLQVLMPVAQIETLADDSSVKLVRLPYEMVPEAIGEGVAVIGADVWKNSGFDGTGTKVGILDVGFYGYSSLLGTELPATVTTQWAPSIGGPGTSKHGTACAEIVYDIAPKAQFFLANASTDIEYANAAGWLISQGVNVISHSAGFMGVGPGNGTGPVNDVVTNAKNTGVLWVQAAGNYAQQHWSGTWQDTDGDNVLEFNLNPKDEGQTISVQANQQIKASLTWNDPWETSSNDYDLLLVKSSTGQLVASSQTRQNGNDYPQEGLTYTAPETGNYYLAIGKYSANGAASFHLATSNHILEYRVASGSIVGQPADSPNALTVGAVAWNTPSTLEPYSSQGPTTDGRTKPDVVAPTGVSSIANGGSFSGTSAATPHVAGASLLVKQRYPSYTPAQIQSYLETNAIGLGAAGKDNQYGSGRLSLPVLPNIAVTPSSFSFGNVIINTSSTPREITISNTGSEVLHVTNIILSDTTNYSLNVNGGANPAGSTAPTIAGGSSKTISIVYTPKAIGAHNAVLNIASDDPDTSTSIVSLSGTGIAPPQISFTPASDTTITAGQTVTFVASLDGGSPVADADWKWDFNYHEGDTDVGATGMNPPPQNWNNVVGTYVVRLTATNAAGSDVETRTITVQPAAPHHLAVTGITSPLSAGTASQVIVTAKDQYDNVATGYRGSVRFTSTDSQAILPANYTFLAGDNGIRTFVNGVTLKAAGTQTISATDTVNVSITGASGNITVTPAPLYRVEVTPNPAFLQTGAQQQFSAAVYDQYGNAISGLSFTWSVVNGGGSIGAGGLFTAGAERGTFLDTVKAVATQGEVSKQGTSTVAVGASMSVTATLQGEGRTLAGMDVPLTLKLYNQPVNTGNIRNLETVGVFSTTAGNIAITQKNTTTRVITFTVGGLPSGTYNITLHSPQSLVNLRNGVTIEAQGTTVDMGTLIGGDGADVTEDSLAIDITDFTRFATAYEATPARPNWNDKADFNRNGQVEVTDFSMLFTNYGKTSPQLVQ